MHLRHFCELTPHTRRDTLRSLVTLSALAGSTALWPTAARAAPGPYHISTQALEKTIAQALPIHRSVNKLLQVDLQAARLKMLPATNRIGALIDVQASGLALNRSHDGTLHLEFSLRYEHSDHSLRAHAIQVQSLSLPTLPAQTQALLNMYSPKLSELALGELVLHRLRAPEAALLDTMGVKPEKITVTPHGIDITITSALFGANRDSAP